MLHFFHFVKRQVCKSWLMKACKTFSSLEREGDRRTSVESRIHYVNQKEWRQYVTLLPQNYEIFDFHTTDSPVFASWWKVECCMWIHGICYSSLFYKRGYSQNPPPVPLQEAHRPAILKLRHRPTSVQDVPTCEPLARTDHEPKAHLCMLEYRKACCCSPSDLWKQVIWIPV